MLHRWIPTLALAVVLVAMVFAQGCNTVRGVGKDVEKSGEAIQRSTHK